MKKPGKKKARRSRPQRAKKRRRKNATGAGRPASSEPRVELLSMSYEGDDFFDPDHCPYCRAMADQGIHPNESVTISQYEKYMARAEELIEEQGLPAGTRFTGKELNEWFDWIRARLAAEGRKTDPEEMTDAELRAHMTRVTELSRAYALRN